MFFLPFVFFGFSQIDRAVVTRDSIGLKFIEIGVILAIFGILQIFAMLPDVFHDFKISFRAASANDP